MRYEYYDAIESFPDKINQLLEVPVKVRRVYLDVSAKNRF